MQRSVHVTSLAPLPRGRWRAAPARRCGLQPGGARWRTVWTGPTGGQISQEIMSPGTTMGEVQIPCQLSHERGDGRDVAGVLRMYARGRGSGEDRRRTVLAQDLRSYHSNDINLITESAETWEEFKH